MKKILCLMLGVFALTLAPVTWGAGKKEVRGDHLLQSGHKTARLARKKTAKKKHRKNEKRQHRKARRKAAASGSHRGQKEFPR
jgi:hypothetical protein